MDSVEQPASGQVLGINVNRIVSDAWGVSFTRPVANALSQVASWWCLDLVGRYYRDNMPELNHTVWDAARASGGPGFNYRVEL